MLLEYLGAYKNKLSNKINGVIHIKTRENKVGSVLLSFITGPFTLTPKERFTDPHTNYWVCPEIARLFLEKGFDVDIINWDNKTFLPKKKYDVCVDLQHNIERLEPVLGDKCKRVMFIISSYPEFQNNAEEKRLNDLFQRRGVRLSFGRKEDYSKNVQFTDFIGGYGNKTVRSSYPDFIKDKIVPIPVPSMDIYDAPKNKDYDKVRKNFLWFGGGGAILKGLDLIVEAFADLPQLNLSLIGPAPFEEEFAKTYEKELSLPNIKRHNRPRINESGVAMIDDIPLEDIISESAFVIGLSASEGGGAATVQAMQLGLIPITTPQTGINEEAPGFVIHEPTLANIKKLILEVSTMYETDLKKLSYDTWNFAHTNHSKKAFTKKFNEFIDQIVNTQ